MLSSILDLVSIHALTMSYNFTQTVATPKDILKKYFDRLTRAISANINNVTNALHTRDLITPETRGYIVTTVGVANGDKANRVMLDIEGRLGASPDEKQYLTQVCNVLSNQGGAIKQIANVMLQELGM